MHFQTALLTTFALLTPLALCMPAERVFPDPYSLPPVTCQGTPNVPIADYTDNGRWGLNMLHCLGKMDNDQWTGTECQPTDSLPGKMVPAPGKPGAEQLVDTPPPAGAKVLGPSFHFYKEVNGDGASAQECFVACSDCLTGQIDNKQAVTTKCIYKTATWSCWMGMDVVK